MKRSRCSRGGMEKCLAWLRWYLRAELLAPQPPPRARMASLQAVCAAATLSELFRGIEGMRAKTRTWDQVRRVLDKLQMPEALARYAIRKARGRA